MVGAAKVLLFDKAGPLTAGRPSVAAVVTAGDVPADELLRLAASLEQVSPHILGQPSSARRTSRA